MKIVIMRRIIVIVIMVVTLCHWTGTRMCICTPWVFSLLRACHAWFLCMISCKGSAVISGCGIDVFGVRGCMRVLWQCFGLQRVRRGVSKTKSILKGLGSKSGSWRNSVNDFPWFVPWRVTWEVSYNCRYWTISSLWLPQASLVM